MTTTAKQLVELLALALREPLHRKNCIAEFQKLVWAGLDPALPEDVQNVLRDLAFDLDFFEGRAAVRSEDDTLYGNERLEREIHDALGKLEAAGVVIP